MPDNSKPPPAVQIDNLRFRYIGQEEYVLDGVDLDIEQGEMVVLMGPTGCGKSTLALSLNGIIPNVIGGERDGKIIVLGYNPAEKEIHEMATKIGLVLQDPDSQICNIFVKDEVAFGAQNLLVDRREILRRVQRVLHFVGLEEFEDRSVFELSGGEKQRLSIASVLAMEPQVIVLDEPTASLDPEGTVEVKNLVRELKENRGVTIILIEHNISGLLDLADRVIIMANGKVAFEGSPRQVLSQHGQQIRDEIGLRIPEVSEFALEAQTKGYRFEPLPLTVEDVRVDGLVFKNTEQIGENKASSRSFARGNIIEVRDVNFIYPNGAHVLHNINADIRRGEVFGIVGHNGSGKSTLTSLFIGLNRPTSGHVSVDGLDASRASIKNLAQKVGYVFQYPEHQFVTDSVREEIAFGMQGHDLAGETVQQRVEEMLERFHLDLVADRHPLSLSRGQKRRLSVASMLVLRPQVFILDEPTTGQDRKSIQSVMDHLMGLNEEGLTIIVVSHDMELVATYTDRVLVLDRGRVAFMGPTCDLFAKELTQGDRYGLSTPEIFKVFQRVNELAPWLPLAMTPFDLANLLAEREV